MAAVPAEDWDLVVWNVKYFGKVQLWKEGKARIGLVVVGEQSRYHCVFHPITRGVRLVKLVFAGFRQESRRWQLSELQSRGWPLLWEMDTVVLGR